MSQVTVQGKYVNAAQPFQSSTFSKQSIIVEVVDGNYVSYFNLEFHQADVQNLFPQLQPNASYNFVCFIQGSRQQMTDKNGQPTAYTALKCVSFTPANAQAPQQQAPQGFNQQPAAQPQGFGQPAQQQAPAGFGGQPAPAQQPAQGGFGAPAQQSFGQPAQQPAQGGFGAPAPQNTPPAFGS